MGRFSLKRMRSGGRELSALGLEMGVPPFSSPHRLRSCLHGAGPPARSVQLPGDKDTGESAQRAPPPDAEQQLLAEAKFPNRAELQNSSSGGKEYIEFVFFL